MMSGSKYSPDEYKRKLKQVIRIYRAEKSKRKKSKPKKLKERQATPYSFKNQNLKINTNSERLQCQLQFNSDSDNSSSKYSGSNSGRQSDQNNEWHPSTSQINSVDRYRSVLKRQLTPSSYSNKKIKRHTAKNKKQICFQVETPSQSDSDEASSAKFLSAKCGKRVKNTDINFSEVICDNTHNEVLTNNGFFLTTETEESENSSTTTEEFSITNFDCSNSYIDRNSSPKIKIKETDKDCQYIRNNSAYDIDRVINNGIDYVEDAPEDSEVDLSQEKFCLNTSTGSNISIIISDDFEKVISYKLNNGLLIVLHGSKLYFHGLMSVSVLSGIIEILGYILTASSESVETISPRGSSYLYLEAKKDENWDPNQNDFLNKLCALGMEDKEVEELSQNLQSNSAVILCKELYRPELSFISRHIPQQLFPKCELKMPQFIFQSESGTWNVLKTNTKWDVLVNAMDVACKVLICGGKSVGKSTVVRYMINKLLLQHSSVLVIDLDPGQPEFTVSGCVSATVVTKAIFGPNYTHLKKPDRCFFVPNINVSYEPGSYLRSVEDLVTSCFNITKMPTLINYMGFTQGLGLEIFAAVAAFTQPTSVVQIESNLASKNFRSKLTYKLIVEKAKLLAPNVNEIPEFDIFNILSMADENEGWHLQPRQIREMCVLSYLSKILPKDISALTDSDVRAYVVDMSEVKIMHNNKIVSPAAINGNFIALCSLEAPYKSYTCHGWGVVRGINVATNELYLVTPTTLDDLDKVDYFILGSVALPPSLYMTPDNNSGIVPFVSEGVLTILGKALKRSYVSANTK